MPRKSSRSSRSRRRLTFFSRRSGLGSIILLAVVVFLVSAFIYWRTGQDPLGLINLSRTAIAVVDLRPSPQPQPPPTGAVVTTGGGDWWEVYFSDPATHNDPNQLSGSIPEKLIERINTAKKSIHIAAFEFNLTPVAQALIAAHNRGVEVQWVTDDENGLEADTEDGHGQFALLEQAGVRVNDDGGSGLMHNKFWIFDGEVVWTGSTNVTVNDNFRNNNNVIVLKSPQVAAIYEREFQEMWAGGQFGPTSPSTVADQSLTIDGTPLQFLFASEDDALSHLIPLIQGAAQSIHFMAFSFTHDGLGDAMLARAQAGVNVQGIFETRGSETEFSQLPKLYCAQVLARQDGNPGTFHHKVIVIDAKTVVTGSLNFSNNADDSNDENVIVVTNPEIATLYEQEFQRRLAEATEPNPDRMRCG